jgi:hypothetical protein
MSGPLPASSRRHSRRRRPTCAKLPVPRVAVSFSGRESGHRLDSEAGADCDAVTVDPRDQPESAALLPESVLHYVLRTQESVILDDPMAQPPFAADP